jgi:magnesium transporter
MPFISELLGRPVLGANGARIGKIHDLLAPTDVPYPPVRVVAISPRHGKGLRFVPWIRGQELDHAALRLSSDDLRSAPETAADGDLWLRRDVLDKQIVDVEGAKLVRVNDIQLTRIDHDLRVAAVDNTGRGFLRRIGLEGVTSRLSQHNSRPTLIDWEEIDLVPGPNQNVRLKVPYRRLQRMRPAEIADVVGQLSPSEGAIALESMDDETAAQTLAELSPEHATAVLNVMDEEEAADILEEMDADDAADILADLDDDFAADLMRRMETEAAEDVRELLIYPEDSAGGLMNNDFVAISEGTLAGEVIDLLRRTTPETETIYYLYALDAEERLAGIVSLRDIVVARPDTPVAAIMARDVVSVPTTADEAEVARVLIKYNLVVVPVVDDQRRLVGTIAVDDVLDLMAPRAWQNRPRRMLA